jgi:hypothetical protein
MVSSRKLRRDDTISKQVEVTSCTSCDDEEAGCDLKTTAAEVANPRRGEMTNAVEQSA